MQALEAGECGVSLVVDDDGVLRGTLTDGDIRRGLLHGAALDSPVTPHFQRRFTAVSPSEDRASVLDLMQSRFLSQIPVVDSQGRLVGLHLLRELLGSIERPNVAIVMAGGRGVRLGAITQHLPKPMVPVAGRPILERIVLHLVGYGIRRIYLSVHYLGNIIEDYFADGRQFGCEIRYLREEAPLGTAGALTLLPEIPKHPFLVMNGDLVTQIDLAAMLDFHDSCGFEATMAVRPYSSEIPFGCVETEGHRIVSIAEKPTVTRLINAGIYLLDPSALSLLAPGQEAFMTTLFEQLIQNGRPTGAFEILGDWIDVGQPAQLKMAREGESSTTSRKPSIAKGRDLKAA